MYRRKTPVPRNRPAINRRRRHNRTLFSSDQYGSRCSSNADTSKPETNAITANAINQTIVTHPLDVEGMIAAPG